MYEAFLPDRWTTKQGKAYITNFRDSLFLTVADLTTGEKIASAVSRGSGPGEFNVASMIETSSDNARLGLYDLSPNKVVFYEETLQADPPVQEAWKGFLPGCEKMEGNPKPYTRLAQVNDTVVAGTYLMSRQNGVDFIDVKNGQLLSETTMAQAIPSGDPAGPYEFKVAIDSDGKTMVAAYRYLDRVDVYKIERDTAQLCRTIGRPVSQANLYKEDRDDEMVKFYSDVAVRNGKAYLLWQGVPEQQLGESHSFLQIYDLATMKNLANIDLGGYFRDLLVNDDVVYLYSPTREDYIFSVRP